MTVIYLPLEPYQERYTLQLRDWTVVRMEQLGIPHVVIEGDRFDTSGRITTGVALDAHGRSYYALTQTAKLVAFLSSNPSLDARDCIYSQDLFAPGYEALPYIFAQVPRKPRVFTHLLAQSIDPNDFTFPMRRWMRDYEQMVTKTCDGVFVASTCMVDMMRAALLDNCPVHVVGLPFDMWEVQGRVTPRHLVPLNDRAKRVVFSSRWDAEKQPHFYMDVIERIKTQHLMDGWEFCVCTGAQVMRSNDPTALQRAREQFRNGWLKVYANLSKANYYSILADSRMHFNCALQDFVSNTLNEASALGVPSVLPAFLSFPEAVENNERQLYSPWSVASAIERLMEMASEPINRRTIERPARKAHDTLNRVFDVMGVTSQ